MIFIEAPPFTRKIRQHLLDEEYGELQGCLMQNPEAGSVIQGTGGLRKLRWSDKNRNKGKRGGIRVIYYYFLSDQQILLLTLYGKNEKDDLSSDDKKIIKALLADDKERGNKHEK